MNANQTIRFVNETTAQVTKSFAKQACLFGTQEFTLWMEYKKTFPNAQMVTKTIKKDPDKKTRRNMTYKNMVEFINTQENKKELLAKYEIIKQRSKIQKSPYQYVLSWFEAEFKGYNDLAKFMKDKEAERNTKDAENEAEDAATENE